MKHDDWPVKESDCRQNRKHCFICGSSIGDQHIAGCFMRQRTVVVKVTFEYVKVVPESFDASQIEFQANESSQCCNRLFGDITETKARLDANDQCFCFHTDLKYVREATEHDEENFSLRVNDAAP